MGDIKSERIVQIRSTLRKERFQFNILSGVAGIGYLGSATLGLTTIGWVALVVALAVSFLAVLSAVAMSSWELEANLLEGPRVS